MVPLMLSLSALVPGLEATVLLQHCPADAWAAAGFIAADVAATAKEVRVPRLTNREVLLENGLLEERVGYLREDGTSAHYCRRWWQVANPHTLQRDLLRFKTLAWVVGTGLATFLPPSLLLGAGRLAGLAALLHLVGRGHGLLPPLAAAGWGALMLRLAENLAWPIGAISFGVWQLPALLQLWQRPPQPTPVQYDPVHHPMPLFAAGTVGLGSLATPTSLFSCAQLGGAGAAVSVAANSFAEAMGLGLAVQGAPSSRTALSGFYAVQQYSPSPTAVSCAVGGGLLLGHVLHHLVGRYLPREGARPLTLLAGVLQVCTLLSYVPLWYLLLACGGGLCLHHLCRQHGTAKSFVYASILF